MFKYLEKYFISSSNPLSGEIKIESDDEKFNAFIYFINISLGLIILINRSLVGLMMILTCLQRLYFFYVVYSILNMV